MGQGSTFPLRQRQLVSGQLWGAYDCHTQCLRLPFQTDRLCILQHPKQNCFALSVHRLHMHLMQAAGGEDLLLAEFEGLGLHCDPQTQLVVTCEVCRRPATKECWTCGMKICEFCTLKRHWKVGLHPVVHRLA